MANEEFENILHIFHTIEIFISCLILKLNIGANEVVLEILLDPRWLDLNFALIKKIFKSRSRPLLDKERG